MKQILITESILESPYEALKLVKKLNENGTYNLFRGQKECWSLDSTFSRLSIEEAELAKVRLNRFAGWILSHTDLKELGTKDKIVSVAQHYGLPTSFVDFTYDPEVALFFSTYMVRKEIETGCIYCASKEELEVSLKTFLDNIPIEFKFSIIDLEVENLWRLQSQKGLFLNAPISNFPNWEDFLPFHKIVFFHDTKFRSNISKDVIFPNRKSRLEIKLDQYFREEEVHDGLDMVEKKGFEIVMTPWESNYHIFKNFYKPIPSSDWNDTRKDWVALQNEHYKETVSKKRLDIEIKSSVKNSEELKQVFYNALFNTLQSDSTIKKIALDFKITFYNKMKWSKQLNSSLELFWDGVRQFPYSNMEISEGFGNLAAILCLQKSQELNHDRISAFFGETYCFEFLIKNAGHSRVVLPKKYFIEALNNSLLMNVDTSFFSNIKENFDLIYHIHDVDVLFNVSNFKSLLIKYIIPCQIIENIITKGNKRGLVVYSPFEIIKIRSAIASVTYSDRYRNIDRIIALHPNLSDKELILLMADALKKIEKGQRPIMITISGFESDNRILSEIPKAVVFCKRLLKIGFPSILEMSTNTKNIPEGYNPYALGAFEVWLIAEKKYKTIKDTESINLWNTFYKRLILECNKECDLLVSEINSEISDDEIENIKLKGLLGHV